MNIKESRKQKVTAALLVPALIISIFGLVLFIASSGASPKRNGGEELLFFSAYYVLTVGILLAIFGLGFVLKGKSIFAVFGMLTLVAAVTLPNIMSKWFLNLFSITIYPYSFFLMILIIMYAMADDTERRAD